MVFIDCYHSDHLPNAFVINWSYYEPGTFELGTDRGYIWTDSHTSIYMYTIMIHSLESTFTTIIWFTQTCEAVFIYVLKTGKLELEKSHVLIQITESERNQIKPPTEEAAKEAASIHWRGPHRYELLSLSNKLHTHIQSFTQTWQEDGALPRCSGSSSHKRINK